MVTIRTVFSCVASRNREAARPRASATPEAPRATVHCLASAATGSAGRRSRREAMPTACTSATAESTRRTVVAMRTVFSCVASRNRCRWTLQPGLPAEKKRVAVVQLDARLQTINRESSALRPPPRGRFAAWAQRPAILRIATSSEKISAPKLGRDLRSRGPAAPHRLAPVPLGTRAGRSPTLSGRIYLFPLPRSSRGAPTFCNATESRQRTQPRGLRPLGHPPLLPELGRANSSLRVPSSTPGLPRLRVSNG